MSALRIGFEAMEWQQVRDGVRQKAYCEGSRQLRLVEFGEFSDEVWWCDLGHIGYVLKGSLQIDFDGKVLSFTTGDGLFIPAGATTRHRGMNIEPGTVLLMVEDL